MQIDEEFHLQAASSEQHIGQEDTLLYQELSSEVETQLYSTQDISSQIWDQLQAVDEVQPRWRPRWRQGILKIPRTVTRKPARKVEKIVLRRPAKTIVLRRPATFQGRQIIDASAASSEVE